MRLVNYGLGEVLDRLSILGLKLLHAEQAGRDVTSFERERNALTARLSGGSEKLALGKDALDRLWELAAVNAALWHAEDEMRELRGAYEGVSDIVTLTRAGRVGIRIQELNDRRATLVGAINKASGDEHQEKVSS